MNHMDVSLLLTIARPGGKAPRQAANLRSSPVTHFSGEIRMGRAGALNQPPGGASSIQAFQGLCRLIESAPPGRFRVSRGFDRLLLAHLGRRCTTPAKVLFSPSEGDGARTRDLQRDSMSPTKSLRRVRNEPRSLSKTKTTQKPRRACFQVARFLPFCERFIASVASPRLRSGSCRSCL